MARRPGWEKLPRSPAHPSPSPHLDDDDDIGASAGRRRSITYCRLPEQLLRLSVLKLDGSTFEVEVARTASVVELKMEIEGIFSESPDEGGCSISWSHVWGHFCLCYKEHKLIDDGAYLRAFGIRDGDELHFTRHLSLNHNANRRRLRNRGTETVEENGNKDSYKQSFRRCGYVDERRQDHGRRDWSALRTQSKLGRFLRRCCSTPSAGKTEPERQRSKAIGKRNKLCWAICR
ncbi:hypothetical protein OPV22_010654 [Ensete ventricosum]|uniref:SNRNP25 ubiquitin-like domain-containing protein n=1 Tax=Ensete ventricosum TaxID=4639 RepID=A0AAV8RLU2_ENSVE|nr:hypothetical protein OPV22_010654 [Ensete ventricosum]